MFDVASDNDADFYALDFGTLSSFDEGLAADAAVAAGTFRFDISAPRPPGATVPELLARVHAALPDNVALVIQGTAAACAALESHVVRFRPPGDRPHWGWSVGECALELTVGDIVESNTDVLVNASNTRLELGSGVSGALRRAAGPRLQEAMTRLGPIEAGDVAMTGSFRLGAVGAILHAATVSGTDGVVQQALNRCLEIAADNGFRSITVPGLGTGVGGMRRDRFGQILASVLSRVGAKRPARLVVLGWTTQEALEIASGISSVLGPEK